MKKRDRATPYYTPRAHNLGSKFQTPASLSIEVHYANQLIIERWTWDRFARLCRFAKLTPGELASLVRMPHSKINRFMETQMLPREMLWSPAVALLLTVLEAHFCGAFTKDVIRSPFPNLSLLPESPDALPADETDSINRRRRGDHR